MDCRPTLSTFSYLLPPLPPPPIIQTQTHILPLRTFLPPNNIHLQPSTQVFLSPIHRFPCRNHSLDLHLRPTLLDTAYSSPLSYSLHSDSHFEHSDSDSPTDVLRSALSRHRHNHRPQKCLPLTLRVNSSSC